MELWIILMILPALIMIAFNGVNKINIENIINNGNLLESDLLKGEIFYKSSTIDGEDNLCFYSYIRLNDGTDITVNNEDIYRAFSIGDSFELAKNIYRHKAQKLTFYLIKLDSEKELRICEKLDTVD